MTSRTGNGPGFTPLEKTHGELNSLTGFTFIELMTAVSILSLGLVMISRIFLSSLDYINHAASRIYVGLEADNQLWAMQDISDRSEEKCVFPLGGGAKYGGVSFGWRASVESLKGMAGLSKMVLSFSWLEKGKNGGLTRAAYVGR
jgi:prepilin-type N-terminal cleavage/methylation domain-containing protein